MEHTGVRARFFLLEHYLKKLQKMQKISKEEYIANTDFQDIVERNFHLAIECVLDIASHIVATHSSDVPKTYADIFRILGILRVIPQNSIQKFQEMAGFRNVLVHAYATVSPEEIYQVLQDDLRDFDEILAHFLAFLGENLSGT